MNRDSLSIILPAYNEEALVGETVAEVSQAAGQLGREYEIILVDDGSTDGTAAVGRNLEGRIPHFKLVTHFPNRHYGGALKAGFEAAGMELIAFFPADHQYYFSDIQLLLDKLQEADIVSGYRKNRQDHVLRKINAAGWNWLVRILFGRLCRDIDCGFKLFRAEILRHVHLVSNGALIDTELLAGSKSRGYRIAEVEINHRPRTAGRATGANLRVILTALLDLIRFRVRLHRELRAEQNNHRPVGPGPGR